MTLRELASPRFYASLIADLDLDFGRGGALGAAPVQRPPQIDDDFEETRPCSWYVTAPDDPPSALR